MIELMNIVFSVLLLVVVFALLYRFRTQLVLWINSLPLPTLALYLATAFPLAYFEEQVNCIPAWCSTLIIPYTVPVLLAELLIIYFLYLWLKPKKIRGLLLAYTVFGMAWELFLGGLRGAALPPAFFAFMVLWVGFSYLFIGYIPLLILHKRSQ